MTFETYARAWLEKQEFIKRTRKTTRQALEVYSFPVIGNKELTDIIDSDIDQIFYSVRLFNRKGDRQSFMHSRVEDSRGVGLSSGPYFLLIFLMDTTRACYSNTPLRLS